MPEIAEVARVVHYIRQHLAGKTLAKVTAQHDENVYGKVGASAEMFEKALTGKKVLDAKQQGKYFWMVMSSPPHPLMHFGMTGWLKVRGVPTYYYKTAESEGEEEWPPKYHKFILETAEKPKCEAAFIDARRFARIRLIDCDAKDIRNVSPLVENGPDPVQDRDFVTKEWLAEKLESKRIPVKAFLLDQANISGIGNWVGDEVLYHAKIHPEQYSNTLSAAQVTQLHKSIRYVCDLAVDKLADSTQFPEDWLFKHRWGKGKKDSPKSLPNGAKIVFLTVGGRTSAVIPSIQKKTGPVAGDIKEEEAAHEDEVKSEAKLKSGTKQNPPKKGRQEPPKGKSAVDTETNISRASKTQTTKKRKSLPDEAPDRAASDKKAKAKDTDAKVNGVKSEETGRRRSARMSGRG